MANLFKEHRWTGEFFTPNSYTHRFLGEIDYSPEKGVILSYTTPHKNHEEAEVLHGMLSSGEKCTLFGSFSTKKSGIRYTNGLMTRRGRIGFSCLAIGELLNHDEELDNLDFTLTNLQEFFHLDDHQEQIKYSEKPIYSVETPFGQMEVYNTATFGHLGSDLASLIYSDDVTALEDLSQTLKAFERKYPRSFFMLKKDISYRILLKFTSKTTIHAAYKEIMSFSNLFALLTYKPVYPESIKLISQKPNKHSIEIDLYPSMVLSSKTIELATQIRSH